MNYLEMCNEVLIRMREDEITDIKGADLEPQQKLVTKFVQDAYTFVQKSHTWNSCRRIWIVSLAEYVKIYHLFEESGQAQIYSIRFGGSEQQLIEVNQRYLAGKKDALGKPCYYSPSRLSNEGLGIEVYPVPDDRYDAGVGLADEYSTAEYAEAEYNGDVESEQSLVIEGYKMAGVPLENESTIDLPYQPVLYYALALSSRERGEVGGQSSQELFGLSRSYLSDAISWDVSDSRGEYIWEAR